MLPTKIEQTNMGQSAEVAIVGHMTTLPEHFVINIRFDRLTHVIYEIVSIFVGNVKMVFLTHTYTITLHYISTLFFCFYCFDQTFQVLMVKKI